MRRRRQIPPDIAENPELEAAIASALPTNYRFEVKKTLWRLRESGARRVALQLPEGLLIYANTLADLLRQFHPCETVVLADVTFGACCVDDLTAKALECDFLVHYGHSCLVPSSATGMPSLYVFVEIDFDVEHLCACVRAEFRHHAKIALAGTIQFGPGIARAEEVLECVVPQELPLSAGEVLGCTSPKLPDVDAFVFVADGRFHLESLMIRNPKVPAYRYDPYAKTLTRERYDHARMLALRDDAVRRARCATRVGLVLGTLGRQGSPKILERLEDLLTQANVRHFTLIASEVSHATLARLADAVDAWVQVACPRLSIDWGHAHDKPLLSPYEAFVAFDGSYNNNNNNNKALSDAGDYPMDYYARNGGPWSNYYYQRDGSATK